MKRYREAARNCSVKHQTMNKVLSSYAIVLPGGRAVALRPPSREWNAKQTDDTRRE